jgi:hypothetical protein
MAHKPSLAKYELDAIVFEVNQSGDAQTSSFHTMIYDVGSCCGANEERGLLVTTGLFHICWIHPETHVPINARMPALIRIIHSFCLELPCLIFIIPYVEMIGEKLIQHW